MLMGNGELNFAGTTDTMYYVAPCMAMTLFPFAVMLEGKSSPVAAAPNRNTSHIHGFGFQSYPEFQ